MVRHGPTLPVRTSGATEEVRRNPVVHADDLNVLAGARRVDHHPAAEVHGHVVDRAGAARRPPEQQVPRAQLARGDVAGRLVLADRPVRQRAAGGGPGLHGEAGAVPGARTRGTPAVGLAELGLRERDRLVRTATRGGRGGRGRAGGRRAGRRAGARRGAGARRVAEGQVGGGFRRRLVLRLVLVGLVPWLLLGTLA